MGGMEILNLLYMFRCFWPIVFLFSLNSRWSVMGILAATSAKDGVVKTEVRVEALVDTLEVVETSARVTIELPAKPFCGGVESRLMSGFFFAGLF